MNDRPQAVLRCECGCAVLCLDWFPPFKDEVAEGYMDVYTHPRANGFRSRLKMAWRILRGKDPWVDAVVFGPKQVAELQGFLARCNPASPVTYYKGQGQGVNEGQGVNVRYGAT